MPDVVVPSAGLIDLDWAQDLTNKFNAAQTSVEFLRDKPAAMMAQAAAQSVTTATWTSLTFTTEALDDDPAGTGGHSTSVNTSRYTAVYAGWYRVGGQVGWVTNATGRRGARWMVNGVYVAGSAVIRTAATANEDGYAAPAILLYLAIGDYAELQGYQSSGGALNTGVAAGYEPAFAITWERDAA